MKILLSGRGAMARTTAALARDRGWQVLGLIGREGNFPCSDRPDILLDFSHPEQFSRLETYIRHTGIPLLCGTTGLSPGQMASLSRLAESVPVLYSATFCPGVLLLQGILKRFGPILRSDYDVELVESHHRRKTDAPSGTALSLAGALDPEQTLHPVHGRRGKRQAGEMGVFSLRGGTAAGSHTLCFFGQEETLFFTHQAAGREAFAHGALKAAAALLHKPPGFYGAEDLLPLFSPERSDHP